MDFANYHTHSYYCDGAGEPESYVKKAIELGFFSIGFSSHAPVGFENSFALNKDKLKDYLENIEYLKHKYIGTIEIYSGLEVDYFEDTSLMTDVKKLNLDYIIGSVHYIKNKKSGKYLGIDCSQEECKKIIKDNYNGDGKKFVFEYYSLVRDMIKYLRPPVIGHLDLLKKNNRNNLFFSENENWYKDEVIKTLETTAEAGSILEVNTGGMARKYINTTYPSPWILRIASDMNIPVTLSSDAHSPDVINAYFDDASAIIKNAGYIKISIIKNGDWVDINLDMNTAGE